MGPTVITYQWVRREAENACYSWGPRVSVGQEVSTRELTFIAQIDGRENSKNGDTCAWELEAVSQKW